MFTYEEAKRYLAKEKSGHILSKTAAGRYQLADPSGSLVRTGSLIEIFVKADIPFPVRSEEEAALVVQAKMGNALGAACEGPAPDCIKLVGIGMLLSEMQPGREVPSAPWHLLQEPVLGQGKTWKEALASIKVRVCD